MLLSSRDVHSYSSSRIFIGCKNFMRFELLKMLNVFLRKKDIIESVYYHYGKLRAECRNVGMLKSSHS